MRPKYESRQDRVNQRKIARALARAWGVEMFEGGEYASLDYDVVNAGELVAKLEVKRRKQVYDTVYLSHKKRAGVEEAHRLGVDAYFAVWVPGGIYYATIRPDLQYVTTMAGRRDRGDPDDIEPVWLVPWADFTRACGEP